MKIFYLLLIIIFNFSCDLENDNTSTEIGNGMKVKGQIEYLAKVPIEEEAFITENKLEETLFDLLLLDQTNLNITYNQKKNCIYPGPKINALVNKENKTIKIYYYYYDEVNPICSEKGFPIANKTFFNTFELSDESALPCTATSEESCVGFKEEAKTKTIIIKVIDVETDLCSTEPNGDVDGNGYVNILDKVLIRNHFGQTRESEDWLPAADQNCDGVINILDKTIVGNNFGNWYLTNEDGKTIDSFFLEWSF